MPGPQAASQASGHGKLPSSQTARTRTSMHAKISREEARSQGNGLSSNQSSQLSLFSYQPSVGHSSASLQTGLARW